MYKNWENFKAENGVGKICYLKLRAQIICGNSLIIKEVLHVIIKEWGFQIFFGCSLPY